VTQISTANSGATPMKTFVVGLGTLGNGIVQADMDALDLMANAGGVACTGGFCKGHKFYPAESAAGLAMALDLILQQVVMSAPGGSCGDFACFPSGAACPGSASTCCGSAGCKNVQSDPNNCGTCDNACGGTGVCSAGHCKCGVATCPAGDRCCGTVCCSALDMATPPVDFATPPPVDLANGLPLCQCPGSVFCAAYPGYGYCVAANCCTLDGIACSATPSICNPN
jgi:hypothetical protein